MGALSAVTPHQCLGHAANCSGELSWAEKKPFLNVVQVTDPIPTWTLLAGAAHGGAGRGTGRKPRPKLHSPNCAGTAGPAAKWEQSSNSSQIPWLGPRKSLELRVHSSHNPEW